MESKSKEDKELGKKGEQAAAEFVERIGMEVLERNWKGKVGEVDIVARDDGAIVFIEVKTRRATDKGQPEEAIGPAKQKKYIQLAGEYLAGLEDPEVEVRFDAISILVIEDDRALLRHHLAAFSES